MEAHPTQADFAASICKWTEIVPSTIPAQPATPTSTNPSWSTPSSTTTATSSTSTTSTNSTLKIRKQTPYSPFTKPPQVSLSTGKLPWYHQPEEQLDIEESIDLSNDGYNTEHLHESNQDQGHASTSAPGAAMEMLSATSISTSTGDFEFDDDNNVEDGDIHDNDDDDDTSQPRYPSHILPGNPCHWPLLPHLIPHGRFTSDPFAADRARTVKFTPIDSPVAPTTAAAGRRFRVRMAANEEDAKLREWLRWREDRRTTRATASFHFHREKEDGARGCKVKRRRRASVRPLYQR
jgi:hypothetical protein